MNVEEALRHSQIFGNLNDRQRARIANLMSIRRFDSGTVILQQGTSAVTLYLILDGQVRVTREPEDGGTSVSLATLGAGDVFGEMAVLDEETRSSTITALEPTRCALLPRWELIQELRRQPDLAIELLRIFARRIRILDERLALLNSGTSTPSGTD
jgi:CRP/FNR family transcriptional regulator, cyclic AMP receptor protein